MEGGFELIVHKLASELGVPVVGFINEGTVPGQIAMVKDLVLAGAYKDWVAPAAAAMGIADEAGGYTIFAGGGGTVTKAIAEARRMGVRFALMQKRNVPGDGGSSAIACADDPDRAFHSVDDLLRLVQVPTSRALPRARQ